jgi:hypothetical protein
MFNLHYALPFIRVGWDHKATLALQPFMIYGASPPAFLIIPDTTTSKNT